MGEGHGGAPVWAQQILWVRCFFSEGLCGLDPKPVKHGALPAAHGPGSLCLAEAHTSEASRRCPRPGLGTAVGGA